jgi:hypothetical protein
MAFWNSTQIIDVNTGTQPDSGDGDAIRDAFTKVNNSINAVSAFLGNTNVDFLNANIEQTLNSTGYTNINNLFVANATGTTATFTGNITSSSFVNTANLVTGTNLISNGNTYLQGPISVNADIVPSGYSTINLGSLQNPFKTLYVQTTVSTSQIAQTTTSGLLQIHENAPPSDQQDVGVFGNIAPNFLGVNTYAFFGHQYSTNNFVYKITNTDSAKSGNSVIYDGVYGGAQFGRLTLSNTVASTNTSTGTLVAAGGAGIGGNLNIGGSANFGGNINVAGPISYIGGYQVLTTNTPGFNQFNSSAVTQLVVTGANPATTIDTGALILPYGGASIYGDLILGGNITGTPVSTVNYYLGSNGYASFGAGNATISTAGAVTAPLFVGTFNGTLSTSASAQPNITSVGTLTSLQVATTIGAGGLVLSGAGVTRQALVVNSAGANIAGGIYSVGAITATGNVTAPWLVGSVDGTIGNFALGSNIGTLNVLSTATVSGNLSTAGNLIAGANAYITGKLTVAGITSSGNVSAPNASITNLTVGTLTVTSESASSYVSTAAVYATTANVTNVYAATVGNLGTLVTGTLTTASQPNLASAINLAAVGTITAGTWSASVVQPVYGGTGVAGTLTGIAYMNGTGPYTVATGSQLSSALSGQTPSIYGTNFAGSAGSLSIGGSAPAGSLTGQTLNSTVIYSSLTSTGTVTSGTWSGSFGSVSGANLTGLTAGNLSGTIPSGVLGNSTLYIGTTAIALNRGSSGISLTGTNIDGLSGKASTLAQGGGTGTGMTFNWSGQSGQPTWLWGSNDGANHYVYNPSNFSVNYATSAGYAASAGAVAWSSVSGKPSLVYNDGGTYNINITGTANTAKYADLAENYLPDTEYDIGTVLIFGGDNEVTTTDVESDVSVAGVVSEKPAYLMNSDLEGGVAIALRGRVPCKVIGPVAKGDLMVTAATPGFACSIGRDRSQANSVFAKSLVTDLSEGEKVIEVVIL